MNKLFLVVAVIIIGTFSKAQNWAGPELNPESFPELEIKKESRFAGNSLFGYMNGGAELYLEYEFQELLVWESIYKDMDLKVEIYRMSSPAMAFGIFSVNKFRCDIETDVEIYCCLTKFQIQACKGDYYINIINSSGSQAGLDKAEQILGTLIEKISADKFNFDDYLGEAELPGNIRSVKLFAGKLSLENNAFSYMEYLRGFNNYSVLIVETDTASLFSIRFENSSSILDFFSRYGISEIPLCGEPVTAGDKELLMTERGDIIVRIDAE